MDDQFHEIEHDEDVKLLLENIEKVTSSNWLSLILSVASDPMTAQIASGALRLAKFLSANRTTYSQAFVDGLIRSVRAEMRLLLAEERVLAARTMVRSFDILLPEYANSPSVEKRRKLLEFSSDILSTIVVQVGPSFIPSLIVIGSSRLTLLLDEYRETNRSGDRENIVRFLGVLRAQLYELIAQLEVQTRGRVTVDSIYTHVGGSVGRGTDRWEMRYFLRVDGIPESGSGSRSFESKAQEAENIRQQMLVSAREALKKPSDAVIEKWSTLLR